MLESSCCASMAYHRSMGMTYSVNAFIDLKFRISVIDENIDPVSTDRHGS